MGLIKLNVIGLSYSQFKSGAYALFLEEDNGTRKLSIVIGQCEAQAIAIGLDKNIISPRPLTHDLFISITEKSELILDKIIIHKLEKGIFFSTIVFINKKYGDIFMIDSRTSDAIAIAIRLDAPIYTDKKVLVKANKNYEDDMEKEISKEKPVEENENTIEDLEKKLKLAIQNEDYELAARIRDQIKKINE